MFGKRVDIVADLEKIKMNRIFTQNAAALQETINSLPVDCHYRQHALSVLNYVQRLRNDNLDSTFMYPEVTLNTVLEKTNQLIDPKTDPQLRLNLLEEYTEYAKKLKRNGFLELLGGIMLVFAAVICLALIVCIFIALPIIAAKLGGVLGLAAIVFPSAFLGVTSILSFFLAKKHVNNGARSLIIAGSLEDLSTEVNKGQTKYEVGMKALQENSLDEAYKYLSMITADHANYAIAQLMIQENFLSPELRKISSLENQEKHVGSIVAKVRALESSDGMTEEELNRPGVMLDEEESPPVLVYR